MVGPFFPPSSHQQQETKHANEKQLDRNIKIEL